MAFSDEILMAYVDGEVDDVLRAQIDAALAADPHIAAAVEQHRKLRAGLRLAFDEQLSEPIPDRLMAALTQPVVTESNVVNLADTAVRPVLRWRMREWGALAAMFVLGVSLGFAVWRQDSGIVAAGQGVLSARGELASALSGQLASAQRGDEAVQIGISFNARSGLVCRTFAVRSEQLAGVACHDSGAWRVRLLTEYAADSATSGYRQAATAIPAAVLTMVDQQIAGEPFDAAAEAQARQAGWQH